MCCKHESIDWMDRLQMLLARFPQYGIGNDIATLSEIEQWGVYCFLSRQEE